MRLRDVRNLAQSSRVGDFIWLFYLEQGFPGLLCLCFAYMLSLHAAFCMGICALEFSGGWANMILKKTKHSSSDAIFTSHPQ